MCVCGGIPYEIPTQNTVRYVKIMAAGDSITEGYNCSGAMGAWREPLQAYINAGNVIYDFVGTGPISPYSSNMTDPEHSGWSGYCVAPSGCGYGSLLNKLPSDAAAYLPDIIVIIAGMNDALGNRSPTVFASDYNIMLDAIISASPSSKIIISAIPNARSTQTALNSVIAQYNSQLQVIAFTRSMSFAIIPNIPDGGIDNCYDWHYNTSGNVIIAKAIRDVI